MIAFRETGAAGFPTLDTEGQLPDTEGQLPDTEALGDEIARLAAHLHAATYQLLVLIRAFDEQEGWGGGFLSCAHWLSWRTGIGPGPAREKVRVARALASLPHISSAMAQGQLSFSKVRALTRVASAENETELLELARHATAAHIETLVRAWRRVDRLEDAESETERHRSRHLWLYPDDDGSWVLRGRLDPEVGALLGKALEWAGEVLYRRETGKGKGENGGPEAGVGLETGPGLDVGSGAEAETTAEHRRADALGLVAERALAESTRAADGLEDEVTSADGAPPAHGSSPPLGRADRFQVVVHVEAEALKKDPLEMDPAERGLGHAVMADNDENVPAGTPGLRVPPEPRGLGVPAEPKGLSVLPETARRLACDAGVVHMTHDAAGGVLDVGRKRRSVPPALRRALDYRDGGCRFPGCGVRYSDAHHIVHWADGGETKLGNLVNLCRVHHRAVHEGGFRVEVVMDGQRAGAERGSAARPREGIPVDPGCVGGPEIRFFRPDGRPIPVVPEPPLVPADPAEELGREHRAKGIVPDAWTATPLWHGEVFDLGMAVEALRGDPHGFNAAPAYHEDRETDTANIRSPSTWSTGSVFDGPRRGRKRSGSPVAWNGTPLSQDQSPL